MPSTLLVHPTGRPGVTRSQPSCERWEPAVVIGAADPSSDKFSASRKRGVVAVSPVHRSSVKVSASRYAPMMGDQEGARQAWPDTATSQLS
jgi:hypothetical protein